MCESSIIHNSEFSIHHSPPGRLVLTRSLIAILIATALVALAATTALAHDDEEVGGNKIVVGFLYEPAYEGERNAVSIRVTKGGAGGQEEASGMAMSADSSHDADAVESGVPIDVSLMTEVEEDGGVNVHIMADGWTWSTGGAQHVDGEGHAHIYVDGELLRMVYEPVNHLSGLAPGERHVRVSLSANNHASLTYNGEPVEATAMVTVPGSAGHHETPVVGIEGLHNTLLVEVTHVPSNVSKTMKLRPAFDAPGHYVADLIPTSPGHYRFRFFGTIEGEQVDLTFDSMAGGGDFDDVQPATAIHFPEEVVSARELESAMRGMQTTVGGMQATVAGLETEPDETHDADEGRDRAAATMALIGVVLGASGIALGAVSLVLVIRGRKS